MTAAAVVSSGAGTTLPSWRRLEVRRAAATGARAACFLLGVAVGLVLESRRGFGTDYWRNEAQLSWHMRSISERVDGYQLDPDVLAAGELQDPNK